MNKNNFKYKIGIALIILILITASTTLFGLDLGDANGDYRIDVIDGVDSISGFISNYEGYTPLEEPFLPNPDMNLNGTPIRAADFYEWNPVFGELEYVQAFRKAMIQEGFPETIGMLIDTSRNGWGGPDRPVARSSSNDLNTYVNESRIDRRFHRLNWCNQASGIGERPRANPVPGVDAYIWGLPPGVSDGISNPDFICDCIDRHVEDPMCFRGNNSNIAPDYPNGSIEAPFRGHWNPLHFKILMNNAYPPIEE